MYITLLLIVIIKQQKKVALPRIEPQTMGIFSVMQSTAPQRLFLGHKSTCTYYLFGPCQIGKCRHKVCHTSLPLQPPPSRASHGSSRHSHRHHLHHCYHHPTRREVSPTLTTPPTTLTVQMATTPLTTKPMWHTHPGVPPQQQVSQPRMPRSWERREVTMMPTDVACPSGCATSTTTYSTTNAHNQERG